MTLPLLAFSMVMITGMTGLAIDVARLQLVQSKLQFSLDAAGLAGGATVSTANLKTQVDMYLNTNFNGYLGAKVTGTSVVTNASNTVITLGATATLPTTFLHALNITTMTANAMSQITRAVTGLELVMVLDNTGSMNNTAGGNVSKIQALRSASVTLINSLFSAGDTNNKLWVGVVPFSQSVNIGTSHATWMDTAYDDTIANMPLAQGPGWGPTAWKGCVDARSNGEDITDDPPSLNSLQTLLRQYYWPSDNLSYGAPFNNTPNSGGNNWAQLAYKRCKTSTGTCTTVTGSCSTANGHTCTFTGYKYSSPLDTVTQGPNYLCPQEVTPMTNDTTTLTNAINAMTAQGDTLIDQGLEWGWNMISPRWRGVWGGTMNANNLPLDYGTRGMNKAIILMTDGFNTVDNGAHGAYWFLHNNVLGTTNSTAAVTELDKRTTQLCTAMKNQGIFIYTIALGTDVTPASIALLKGCATADNYFFNSPSTTQLDGIFNQISDSLSNLRVSQ